MTKKGFKTFTIKESTYNKILEIKQKEGKKSISQTITDLIEKYISSQGAEQK